ncbi:DprA-like DNA recombination-mediator protein [Alteromonas phage vB_AmeM_PT11-V22]|uniref:DprA-like protein n=1 Tax=Alteromonas phage vB_AmeM_PT11-V22 TaxID=2704031 RepID=A0A6C0R1R6_9CAUD|nr:DprA-like DNA recombination-mediator protein [Alteromonas phage vB_AmeM_PT11-V22]QHZ59856.1 DprA-like protein [Alteromonas phage vB_AmeM_PT11-V22]
MTNYYTGIGSRQTPAHILGRMTKYAGFLSEIDWVLRSGGAEGADRAFERGVLLGKSCDIYIPWKGFAKHSDNPIISSVFDTWEEAQSIASEIHPAWDKCSRGTKALHARNVYQVLGSDLKTPSKLIIFYAKETQSGVSGGTRTAVELARKNGIPCINMYLEGYEDVLRQTWKEINK